MPIHPEVVKLLKCLSCGGPLALTADGKGLYCGTCQSVVPIREEIPVQPRKSVIHWFRELLNRFRPKHAQNQVTEEATRDSGETKPIPELRALLQLDRTFSRKEYQKIKQGVIPRDMDDKWFIFLEEDWLYLHRRSGNCIYQVRLEPAGAGCRIAEAWVNRDPKQYNCTDDKYDAKFLLWLIDAIILDKEVEMPLPTDWET